AGLARCRLAWIQVLCFAVASLAWSLIEISSRRNGRRLVAEQQGLPFRHFGAWCALGLLCVVAGLILLADLTTPLFPVHDPLAWLALLVAVAAAAAPLWEEADEPRAAPQLQLYLLGLGAVALGL